MNLYDIQQQFRDLVRRIEEADGEITGDMEEALAINDIDWIQKAEAYCVVITESEAEAQAIATEIGRLSKMRQAKTALANRLRTMLALALKERGGSLKLPCFSLSFFETKAVDVDVAVDLSTLPKYLVREKIEPDKSAIKLALEAGKVIAGCRIATHTNLRIK